MPLRVEDTFRDALAGDEPSAGRDVGLFRQPARGRNLRRGRPGLAPDRRRTQPQRPGIHPGPAAGGARLPGPRSGPAAGERHRGDQAVPGPRRAEPAGPHGEFRGRGGGRRGRHPLPAARASAAWALPWPAPPAGTGFRTTSPAPRKPSASRCRSSPRPPLPRWRRSSRWTAWTRIFLGPSDLAASMGLLGQQEHPKVRAAVEHCLAAAAAAGKPAGVNAFNPDTARALSRRRRRLCPGGRRRGPPGPRLRGPRRRIHPRRPGG